MIRVNQTQASFLHPLYVIVPQLTHNVSGTMAKRYTALPELQRVLELSVARFALFIVPPYGGLLVELFSWLQRQFRPSVRPSAPDTMTNTTLEAVASSSGKNAKGKLSGECGDEYSWHHFTVSSALLSFSSISNRLAAI